MNRNVATFAVTAGLLGAGGAWHHFHASADMPRISFSTAVRGNVTRSVACTGTLGAATTVDVGSQVSGTVSELRVDFNSVVHRGDVLARLDPSLFQARVEQAESALAMASASVDVARAGVTDAKEKFDRAQALAARQLMPQSDVDDAAAAWREAEADLHAAQGAVLVAQANLDQSRVDLARAVITSPVDGVVLDRKVDVGQTVAANFQAPSLFSVATDLSRLELQASVDESDIGRVRAGQRAVFKVDAYPSAEFQGSVTQVRLQPTVAQNVVTYTAVIAVDNRELLLRPGMTATIAIEGERHDDVLRIPAAALLFRPTAAVLHSLGEGALAGVEARVAQTVLPGSKAQVWTGDHGRLEPRTIEVGSSDGRYVEVLDGLTEGTRVALFATAAPTTRVAPARSPLAPGPPRWR